MTLNDLKPIFEGQAILWCWISVQLKCWLLCVLIECICRRKSCIWCNTIRDVIIHLCVARIGLISCTVARVFPYRELSLSLRYTNSTIAVWPKMTLLHTSLTPCLLIPSSQYYWRSLWCRVSFWSSTFWLPPGDQGLMPRPQLASCQLNFPVTAGLITVMWTIMCWRMCCEMLNCRNSLWSSRSVRFVHWACISFVPHLITLKTDYSFPFSLRNICRDLLHVRKYWSRKIISCMPSYVGSIPAISRHFSK